MTGGPISSHGSPYSGEPVLSVSQSAGEGSMRVLLLPFTPRFVIYTLSIVLTALFAALAWHTPGDIPYVGVFLGLFGGLSVLGTCDLVQKRHAILRNYPISAHLRFLLEE